MFLEKEYYEVGWKTTQGDLPTFYEQNQQAVAHLE